jgi:hypothetical protein
VNDLLPVAMMVSKDDCRNWSKPMIVAQTGNASNHPLPVANGPQVFLSLQTRAEDYRPLPLEPRP